MHRIPVYVREFPGLNAPTVSEWKVYRWLVPDGERIEGQTIIAELESEFAVVEHEVLHTGILRHKISPGERFPVTRSIGQIECTEPEYEDYLRWEYSRRISVTLAPDELRLVEELKGAETNEQFIVELLRKELRLLGARKRDSDLQAPVTWQGDLNDDCTAIWNGLMLRAESMDGDNWWWAVSLDEGRGIEMGSSNWEDRPCGSGAIARHQAEACARELIRKIPTD